ncbi:hypothetical protein ANCDUO_00620 [Ancylostoma duodenale]|uniref:Chondroitin proteoglycan 4 domain-containing protein n=1 Tax=Ancylostoma duodenale TaxID=51022 RepID=A0A0C2HBJ6_9BILA|nr:hypothetical protein ANCDUO_00620 [Ancylostoma duodenale]
MSATVFYDFPFHPLVLDHNTFLLYCKLAEQRTKCYVEQCKDTSADTVFSPSNFICSFKRTHFTEVRQCLADAEPITFLKCDHQCHDEVVRANSEDKNNGMNQCMIPIVDEVSLSAHLDQPGVKSNFKVCVPEMAQKTVDLVRSFVHWHATDISDWHAVAGHFEALPESCRQIAGVQPDPVLQLINRE